MFVRTRRILVTVNYLVWGKQSCNNLQNRRFPSARRTNYSNSFAVSNLYLKRLIRKGVSTCTMSFDFLNSWITWDRWVSKKQQQMRVGSSRRDIIILHSLAKNFDNVSQNCKNHLQRVQSVIIILKCPLYEVSRFSRWFSRWKWIL